MFLWFLLHFNHAAKCLKSFCAASPKYWGWVLYKYKRFISTPSWRSKRMALVCTWLRWGPSGYITLRWTTSWWECVQEGEIKWWDREQKNRRSRARYFDNNYSSAPIPSPARPHFLEPLPCLYLHYHTGWWWGGRCHASSTWIFGGHSTPYPNHSICATMAQNLHLLSTPINYTQGF